MKLQELFKKRGSWIKGAYAKDKNGIQVSPNASKAVSFCLMAGMGKCYGFDSKLYNKVFKKIEKEINKINTNFKAGVVNLANWNDADGTKRKDVLALVKKLDI